MLEEQGLIDVNKPFTAYARQLAGTQWDKVRVIDALNMAVGLDIQEDLKALTDPMSMFQRFGAAEFGVPNGNRVVETPLDVLRAAKPLAGEAPGMPSRYSTLTTKVLVYVIEGATGRSFSRICTARKYHREDRRTSAVHGGRRPRRRGRRLWPRLFDAGRSGALRACLHAELEGGLEVRGRLPKNLKALQTSGDHKAYLAGDWTRGWVGDVFGKDMPVFNSRQFDAVWADGAMFGNMATSIKASMSIRCATSSACSFRRFR